MEQNWKFLLDEARKSLQANRPAAASKLYTKAVSVATERFASDSESLKLVYVSILEDIIRYYEEREATTNVEPYYSDGKQLLDQHRVAMTEPVA